MAFQMDKENIHQKNLLMLANSSKENSMGLERSFTQTVQRMRVNLKMMYAVAKVCLLIRRGSSTKVTGLTICSMVRALRHMLVKQAIGGSIEEILSMEKACLLFLMDLSIMENSRMI